MTGSLILGPVCHPSLFLCLLVLFDSDRLVFVSSYYLLKIPRKANIQNIDEEVIGPRRRTQRDCVAK